MTTLPKRPRVHKPAKVEHWEWHRRIIWPCVLIPEGRPGILEVNGTCYTVAPLLPGGFCLVNRANQKHYNVGTESEPWTCDCPDFCWRREQLDPKGCKHIIALMAALRSLWEERS